VGSLLELVLAGDLPVKADCQGVDVFVLRSEPLRPLSVFKVPIKSNWLAALFGSPVKRANHFGVSARAR
jgi:hypothetical protein